MNIFLQLKVSSKTQTGCKMKGDMNWKLMDLNIDLRLTAVKNSTSSYEAGSIRSESTVADQCLPVYLNGKSR